MVCRFLHLRAIDNFLAISKLPKYSMLADCVLLWVNQMLTEIGLEIGKGPYDFLQISEKIQMYLDNNYGKSTYRIVCMDLDHFRMKPLAKSHCDDPDNAIPLYIGYSARLKHYMPILNVGKFVGTAYYCEICEKGHNDMVRHTAKCPKRCPSCGRGTRSMCLPRGTEPSSKA